MEGGVEGGVVGGVIGGTVGGTLGGVLGNPLPDAPPAPPMRITSNITPPVKIKDVDPQYPQIARSAKVQGEVILECIINEKGDVTINKVLKSVPMLQQAAMDAAIQWKYQPALLEGKPQAVFLVVRVKFNLSS